MYLILAKETVVGQNFLFNIREIVVTCIHQYSLVVPRRHPLLPVFTYCQPLSPVITRQSSSPVVPRRQLLSPITTSCHPSSPTATRRHLLPTVVTHRHPILLVVTRRHLSSSPVNRCPPSSKYALKKSKVINL